MHDWVGAREAEEILGLGRTRVLQFAREGRLGGLKVSGRWLFNRAELETFAKLERPVGRPKVEEADNA